MKKAAMEKLALVCHSCTACGLGKTRKNVVFGVGNPEADVLFIGEGPGAEEDRQGLPFVGASGQLLDRLFAAVHLNRTKNIYLTNIVKCRPPQNRDPSAEEQDICSTRFLNRQFELMQPKVVVCLGRIAAQRIIGSDFLVSRQHGSFFNKNGIWYSGTYHPAVVVRGHLDKEVLFEDFLKIRDKIREVSPATYIGLQEEPPVDSAQGGEL